MSQDERDDTGRHSENYGMIKNRDIAVIYEKDLFSCRNMLELLWKKNTNIIYVVDDNQRFAGIITNRILLEKTKENKHEKNLINRNCITISDTYSPNLYEKAVKIFEKNHITTAIPVIDKENKICYEIRKKGLDSEKEAVAVFQRKLKKIERSHYLGKEVYCLKRLLEKQDIIVVGTRERFNYIFGDLLLNGNRVHYVDELENVYDFMSQNENLIIDLAPVGIGGRADIFRYCNNGYTWNQIQTVMLSMIESEYCSKLCQITDDGFITLHDFFEKYIDGAGYFSRISIFTNILSDYMRQQHFDIVNQKGIWRTTAFQCDLKLNGITVNRARGDEELTLIEYADMIAQLYDLSIRLADKATVLNFVFDEEVEATEAERFRIERENWDGYSHFSDRLYDFAELYSLGENKREYLTELTNSIRFDRVRTFENNLIVLKDINSRLINIENGVRRTCYQPEYYNGTIYFLGGCTIWGWLVEDQYTIPSLIQKYVIRAGRKYRVVNLGNGNLVHASSLLASLDIAENDIFVFLFPFIVNKVKKAIPVIEIGKRFNEIRRNRYEGVECFFNMVQHCGTNGNIIYSEVIFEELERHLKDIGRKSLQKNNLYHLFRADFEDLNHLYGYSAYLSEVKGKIPKDVIDQGRRIGCIVMNCNPFTLGHRYLVEYAAGKVDYLCLFIVEEDKSYFPFADRFEMLRRGTADLKNVSVLRSGNMIATAVTFPAYFNKQRLIEANEKPVVGIDLKIFAQYIAPAINIRVRFVGEEREDPVTAEYNAKMKEILPGVGIQVVEIPRKRIDGKEISASIVRKNYKKGDFENMNKWVPETTLHYLMENKIQTHDE